MSIFGWGQTWVHCEGFGDKFFPFKSDDSTV